MADLSLTTQQQAVVEDRGGTLLVSAAAGSGKTKVLVDRVLNRIVNEGKNINEFLIITFTNAAAAELRGKIAAAIAKELAKQPENRHLSRQMDLLHLSQISTVHAFCGALIRQYGYLLEVPQDARMLEDSERTELLDRTLETLLEESYEAGSEQFRCLTDTLGAGRTDQSLVDLVKTMFEKLQSQPDPQAWLKRQTVYLEANTELTETGWGEMLLEDTKRQLTWLLARYDWAVGFMAQDGDLAPKYMPPFACQREDLKRMLAALDGPWDEIGPQLVLSENKSRVPKGYSDPEVIEEFKALRRTGKEFVDGLRTIFCRKSAELIAEQNRMAPALEGLIGLVGELDRRFSAEKRRKNLMDFSDQEHLAIRLLRSSSGAPTEVAREVAEGFREIMVDEYQDSNRVQETIFTAICKELDTNRFLVGDVKQSIYGFRQAEPELFMRKYGSFVPADTAQTGQPRKLTLSKNFRSRPEILSAVNDVFRAVMSEPVGGLHYGPEEQLDPGLDAYPETGQTHVEFHVLALEKLPEQEETKYQREAQWVALRIGKMLKSGMPVREGEGLRPVRPEDIAVLFRTRDPISIYSRALSEAGIPVASDGGENLFETPEVKVLVNLLRVLNNPHQDVPLIAVLCSPVFRLSNSQLAKIRSGSSQPRFFDAMRECGEPWCQKALERLEQLRREAAELPADVLVWRLLHKTGLLTAYAAMEGGTARRDNLLAVYQFARKTAAGSHLYLYQLLRALDRAAEAGTLTAKEECGGVILTTMHKSKGLEYPVVFLADLSRKFNFKELQSSVLFDSAENGFGVGAKITDVERKLRYPGLAFEALKVKKQQALISEEMRILYVAMTRPKDYLIMTYAAEHLDKTLERLRSGAGTPAEPWAAASAKCLGDWVLLAALSRMESGELFAVSGRPRCKLLVSEYPWQVSYQTLETLETPKLSWEKENKESGESLPLPEQLLERLTWKDQHRAASLAPSKLTATQLKGRDKDQEAAENARVETRIPQLRRPEFILEKRGLSATERGTAVHLFLQYANFAQCLDEDGVIAELDRLADEEFLTEQQAGAVRPETVAKLFRSELGQRMLGAKELIREFKFSILEDAAEYYPETDGEQVLLQGVIDAAILEEDGLVVIDFKTDRVTRDSTTKRAETYRGQLETYKKALERIFRKPVKEMVLYFLTAETAVTL